MADAVPENRRDSLNVPWIDTVRFVQQLSHDLRNHLNAIELQSAYISELDANPELKGDIKRLREMISRLTALLPNRKHDSNCPPKIGDANRFGKSPAAIMVLA